MSTEPAPDLLHKSKTRFDTTKRYIDACFSVSGYSSIAEEEYEKSLSHLHQSYLHMFEQEALHAYDSAERRQKHIAEDVQSRIDTLRKCQRPLFQSIPKFYDLQLQEMLDHATRVVHKNLDAQICAVFLIDKRGRLSRESIHGITHRKQLSDPKWLPNESYAIDNSTFVGRTAVPSFSPANQAHGYRFGELCYSNTIEQDLRDDNFVAEYALEFGPLYEIMAVPINNRSRTLGVLRIINKIDRRTQKVLRKDPFNERDFFYLSLFASEIGYALFNLERDSNRRLFSSLLKEVTRPSIGLLQTTQPAHIKDYLDNILSFLVNNEALPFTFAVIRFYCRDRSKEEYRIASLAAFDRKLIDKIRDYDPIQSPSNTFVDITCKSKEHLVISDISPKLKQFHNEAWVQTHEFATFCCFPLVCRSAEGEKAYGTLSLYTSYKYGYDTRMIELLQTVSDTIATYLYVENTKTATDSLENMFSSVCELFKPTS